MLNDRQLNMLHIAQPLQMKKFLKYIRIILIRNIMIKMQNEKLKIFLLLLKWKS